MVCALSRGRRYLGLGKHDEEGRHRLSGRFAVRRFLGHGMREIRRRLGPFCRYPVNVFYMDRYYRGEREGRYFSGSSSSSSPNKSLLSSSSSSSSSSFTPSRLSVTLLLRFRPMSSSSEASASSSRAGGPSLSEPKRRSNLFPVGRSGDASGEASMSERTDPN